MKAELKDFELHDNLRVTVKAESGGHIASQTVEAVLMLAILEKLEEIRCGLIDVESAVNPR